MICGKDNFAVKKVFEYFQDNFASEKVFENFQDKDVF